MAATKTAETELTPPAPDPGVTITLDAGDDETLRLLDEQDVAETEPDGETPLKVAAPLEAKVEVIPPKTLKEDVKTEAPPLVADVKPEAKAEPLHPAVREERAKRKAYDKERQLYKAKWEETEREVQRLQARLAQTGMETKAPPVRIAKERLDALKERADKADGLGAVAQMGLEETARLLEERDQVWADRFADLQFRTHVRLSEVSSRARHVDYDTVLEQAGVFEAMRQRPDGTYPNPALARMILQHPDPGEEAYAIAKGRLIAQEDAKREAEPDTEGVAEPVKAEVKPEAKADKTPAPAQPEAEAEAERRGARAVVDKVVGNAGRAKGISGLRKAGPVGRAVTWTREELDTLMRESPQKYLELTDKYPELSRYHLG